MEQKRSDSIIICNKDQAVVNRKLVVEIRISFVINSELFNDIGSLEY